MIIYKYKIEIINKWFVFGLPKGFKPLTFQEQKAPAQNYGGSIFLWALINQNAFIKPYELLALGTGVEMKDMDRANYIGITQQDHFVWHLFWREKLEGK